jgi:hypothetical protein
VLRSYLLRPAESYCFVPAESERRRLADRHAQRVTPLSCGNRPGKNRNRRPKRCPGRRYNTTTYRGAIRRAVDQLNNPRFWPAIEAPREGGSGCVPTEHARNPGD